MNDNRNEGNSNGSKHVCWGRGFWPFSLEYILSETHKSIIIPILIYPLAKLPHPSLSRKMTCVGFVVYCVSESYQELRLSNEDCFLV